MNSKPNRLVQLLNENMKFILSVSFGIFLFILFFQPFPLDKFDFNNRLLFIAGCGAIVFLFMFIVKILWPWITGKNNYGSGDQTLASYLSGFVILVLSAVAMVFYVRYVGSVKMSFYIVFKIILVCLAPPVILRFYDLYDGLIRQNTSLIAEKKAIQKQIEKYEEDNLNKSVEFVSEAGSENLTLFVAEVMLVRSADNYIEIVYQEGEGVRKKLIRNTLKNVEILLKPYSNFIRSHRTCIVNLHQVEKLHHDFSSYWLSMKGFSERIPVSRQYLVKLREAL